MTKTATSESSAVSIVRIADISIPKRRLRAMRDIAALADSMHEVGLLNPIVVTDSLSLISGAHRLAAAKSLGWETIEARKVAIDELHHELIEIDENLIRNELTVLERAEHLERRKAIYEAMHPETKSVTVRGGPGRGKKTDGNIPTVSFTVDTASKTGVSRSTVEQEVKIARSIPKKEREALRGTVVEDRKSDLLKLSRMEPTERKQVIEKIKAGTARSVKDARKAIHREVKTAGPEQQITASKTWRVIHAACGDAEIEANSVDCIITDPPYPREFLPAFSELGQLAARVLKPGGICIAMSGQSYLPEVIQRLGQHLTFHWACAYLTPGGQAVQLWDRNVNTFWKPLLWYVKPPAASSEWHGDVIRSGVNDNDKRFHDWGQSESGMASLVDRFSFPGQTVLDPFVGGGTTGVVAIRLGRKFIGIDKDSGQVAIARKRLSEAM